MDSLDHSSPLSPPHTILVCPMIRYINQMDPGTYFSLRGIKKEDDLSLLESHHLFPLDWSKKKIHEKLDMPCGICGQNTLTVSGFKCDKCFITCHKECVESPPQMKVLYHPTHPLKYDLQGNNSLYNNCNCCGEDIEGFSYSCSICNFSLHPLCAIKPNILSINNPKIHDHALTFFPRINSHLTCDVCALSDGNYSFIYICYQCDFIVHKSCIYLPTTIRISRHNHRLSFTLCHSVSVKDSSCGVCRKSVDGNYGGYSCVKGCSYVVHSKCATQEDVWDGKELEGEPEIEYENIKTFEEIGDGVIQHFSHPNHYMKLEKKENDIEYSEKRCQACILPIYEGGIYNCIKCDFTLHEVCAHLPCRMSHQLHPHPLTLKVDHKGDNFKCTACENDYCGFTYVCCEAQCPFNLDVRCALVSEPFVQELHPHPLYYKFSQEDYKMCFLCGKRKKRLMTCIEKHFNCNIFICFSCVTVPYKVKCRYDEHFLTFFYKDNQCNRFERHSRWCEICEKEICSGYYTSYACTFYTCNVCNVNVCVSCIYGTDPFMKQGESIIINQVTFHIIPNGRLSRPICIKCERHCPHRIAFITLSGMLFCCRECIHDFGKERLFEFDQRWRKNGTEILSENIKYLPLQYRQD